MKIIMIGVGVGLIYTLLSDTLIPALHKTIPFFTYGVVCAYIIEMNNKEEK